MEKVATDVQKGKDFEWFGIKVENTASEHTKAHELMCTDDRLSHRWETTGTTPWRKGSFNIFYKYFLKNDIKF